MALIARVRRHRPGARRWVRRAVIALLVLALGAGGAHAATASLPSPAPAPVAAAPVLATPAEGAASPSAATAQVIVAIEDVGDAAFAATVPAGGDDPALDMVRVTSGNRAPPGLA